jgi:hypothetical protein
MVERIMRAIRLDSTVYREIAEDQNAMSEAAIIVVIVAILSAFGRAIGSGNFFLNLIITLLTAILVNWILWAILTYFVGTAFFQGKTDIPEMMRVLGYANAPNLLGVFGFIPCVGWIIALIGAILAFIAGFLAVREAMEFDTGSAIVTVLISWLISIIISFGISLLIGGGVAATSGLFG